MSLYIHFPATACRRSYINISSLLDWIAEAVDVWDIDGNLDFLAVVSRLQRLSLHDVIKTIIIVWLTNVSMALKLYFKKILFQYNIITWLIIIILEIVYCFVWRWIDVSWDIVVLVIHIIICVVFLNQMSSWDRTYSVWVN